MKRFDLSKGKFTVLVVVFVLAAFSSIQTVRSQSAGTVVSVVPQNNSAKAGQTFTVNITLSNVQNLYGVDVTLDWNNSILQILSATPVLGVESHPSGVLHAPINLVTDSASQVDSEYHLVATSQNPADSFNGSGTIAILTFNVTKLGHSDLTLQSDLADHPLPDEVSSFIDHTNVSGSFDGIVPEFPQVFVLAVSVVVVTAALFFYKNRPKKKAL